MNYVALKAELSNDPTGLGYKTGGPGTYKDDPTMADIINLPRVGISVFRGRINTDELVACVDKTEYSALSAGDKQLFQILISCGTIDTSSATLRSMIAGIFAAGATRTAMIAAASRTGSRAEELFGIGVALTHEDMAKARAS